jgi:hypothetical protein
VLIDDLVSLLLAALLFGTLFLLPEVLRRV